MPENPAFSIRIMRPDDLNQAMNLSIAEGWNQTEKDWKLLLENKDNLCIVAEKDNRIAGTATVLNHGNKIAWIGMVLVDKSLRGMGAGNMLLNFLINNLKHTESVKLDATPAGEPLYRKLGFIAEYKIFRMRCDVSDYTSGKVYSSDVHKIDKEILPDLIELDFNTFGADRSYLLNNLLNNYPDKAFYINRGNKPEGYVFGRDGTRFSYMGPVIALSEDAAKALIIKALKSHTGQPVALDIPDHKEKLLRWLESLGFVNQRHFVRMYLQRNPYPGILKNQYLIGGPEFG
jgi:GNAT superfamily N-acetyltransferase